jgi:hypothetical protein
MHITTSEWTPIGGFKQNPGAFDIGGAIVQVEQRWDGVIRRTINDYARRERDCVYYTGDPRDDGGPYRPDGVARFESLDKATAHLKKRKQEEAMKGVTWTVPYRERERAPNVENAIQMASAHLSMSRDGGHGDVRADGVLAASITCDASTGWTVEVERYGQWAKRR